MEKSVSFDLRKPRLKYMYVSPFPRKTEWKLQDNTQLFSSLESCSSNIFRIFDVSRSVCDSLSQDLHLARSVSSISCGWYPISSSSNRIKFNTVTDTDRYVNYLRNVCNSRSLPLVNEEEICLFDHLSVASYVKMIWPQFWNTYIFYIVCRPQKSKIKNE